MKNFFDCKDEKITEKAFSQSLIISVLSILLCLVMLCSMTYAWFSSDVSSSSNRLKSGHFDLSVTVTPDDVDVATASETNLVVYETGTYTLTKAGTYIVTLTPTNQTTVKGYCIVEIKGKEYRTVAIVNENTQSEAYPDITSPFTFNIVTNEANTTVRFESRWGAPTEYNIEKSDTVTIEASPTENEDTAGE